MYSLDYKLQSHRFSIQTGNKKLADLCSPLYPSSRIRHNGRADITYSLKMRTDSVAGTIYEIFVDGKKKYKTNSRSELFSHLEWIVTGNTLSHLQEFFQIHAGAVVKGRKVILLPAGHGSGKTTLTLSLTRNHYRCLSDDIALIDPKSLMVIPFPRSFRSLLTSSFFRLKDLSHTETPRTPRVKTTNIQSSISKIYVLSCPRLSSALSSPGSVKFLLSCKTIPLFYNIRNESAITSTST